MALLYYHPPMDPYLRILYRDEQLVVLDKPSGLLSVPGKALDHKDSLQLRVQRVLPEARQIHRLDMATSGLLVMALDKASQGHLARQFQERRIQKTYLARVWGKVKGTQGTVNIPLLRDWPNRPKQKFDLFEGKASVTHWQVLDYSDNVTTVKLKPVTGRSHQLRMHMLAIGHPILGDRLYAHEEAKQAAPRLQLHAHRLSCQHPESHEIMDWHSPCPFYPGQY